ncbi:hypothetical protein YOLOSWAG_290 [Erwinia phage vB_EamM_Yoloswag]|uniref:Uncharacterized protein n=1 Tax=Erwinia phage vB_EamM_Yoloswag TaxID=1958956 RepID=A0A1S6L3K6_9CAUD|nr:hypothetical protein HOR66_gp290 [Erwinia phage vB_EamM_Yoloswag]AQT28760.1 hypothetical protein YOLOSWAG_290 [Erwinia phage vB_EamM_Yoloswag]
MKKSTKKILCAIGAGVVTAGAVVGAVVLLGRSDNTHHASVITHGLKELGKAVGGDSMLAGVAVVAATPVAAMATGYGAGQLAFGDDEPQTIIKYVERNPEPTAAERAEAARRVYEATRYAYENDNIAAYDRWEEEQRRRSAMHPWNTSSNVIPLTKVSAEYFLSQDELDEAI